MGCDATLKASGCPPPISRCQSDGHEELCEAVTTPVRGATGEIIGTLRIARDVTAARAVAEKQRETETQLRAVCHDNARRLVP